ncbi:MAG TPA: hypothetical protein VH040_06010 [Usitatibacter sp.]|jgi:hypothetical protein|nr:hypothetical protein [Usitatibacter sp.]
MDTNYPQLGSLRSEAERREAEAYLESGAALGDSIGMLARWLEGLRLVFDSRTANPHR